MSKATNTTKSSILAKVNTDAIRSLSKGELKSHTKEACKEFALSSEKGCKYFGLLRRQLMNLGEDSKATFKLVRDSLVKGGMEDRLAKSATNNAKGHMHLAEFLLREDGVTLCEKRFYAIPVSKAKAVAATISRGGDEVLRKFNKLRLYRGKLSPKTLADFLPKPKADAKSKTPAKPKADAKSKAPAKPESKGTPTPEVKREPTSVEFVVAAINALRDHLPKLHSKDRDEAKSELAKLIG